MRPMLWVQRMVDSFSFDECLVWASLVERYPILNFGAIDERALSDAARAALVDLGFLEEVPPDRSGRCGGVG